jgi:transposase
VTSTTPSSRLRESAAEMLGSPKPRRLNEPIAVSLDGLVPTDHFYRHLETKLDFCFVRDWARELYAERGRPSIDPVVFFKLQLIMFFAGIRSERELIETASLNLAHRWYLGYALDEELPHHSSLARIRQRLGVEIFQRFFECVVDLCQKANLVWGRELYFAATKVEANAGIPSLIPRFSYDATTPRRPWPICSGMRPTLHRPPQPRSRQESCRCRPTAIACPHCFGGGRGPGVGGERASGRSRPPSASGFSQVRRRSASSPCSSP